MSDITPADVLLRVGGRTLHRCGFLAAAGAGRGYVEVKETFTRADGGTPLATFIDRDQSMRVAEQNKVRIEYPPALSGLVDQFGYPYCGPSLEGNRQNVITWSDAVSNWTDSFTPPVTNGFATLGDLSLALVEDDSAVNREEKLLNFSFTGDGVKGVLFHLRAPATPADGNDSRITVFDTVASANRLVVSFTWNADGTLNTATGLVGSVLGTPKKLGNAGGLPVYAVTCQTTSVTAANNHQFYLTPCNTPGNVGKMVIGGIQCENAAFPGSRIKTSGSAVTRAADSLLVPYNFGPTAMSVYVHFLEGGSVVSNNGGTPVTFADPSSTLPFARFDNFLNPGYRWTHQQAAGARSANGVGVPTLGQRVELAGILVGDGSVRLYQSINGGAVTDSGLSGVLALPTSNWSGAGTLRLGLSNFFGTLLDLRIVRGVRTMPELQAVP